MSRTWPRRQTTDGRKRPSAFTTSHSRHRGSTDRTCHERSGIGLRAGFAKTPCGRGWRRGTGGTPREYSGRDGPGGSPNARTLTQPGPSRTRRAGQAQLALSGKWSPSETGHTVVPRLARWLIIGLYVVSALMEVGGIGMVVSDVRGQRTRAAELLRRPRRTRIPNPSVMGRGHIYEGIENDTIRRGGSEAGAILSRRARQSENIARRIGFGAAQAEMELMDELVKILGGSLFRKLLGPGLLVAGVLIGTIANVANT